MGEIDFAQNFYLFLYYFFADTESLTASLESVQSSNAAEAGASDRRNEQVRFLSAAFTVIVL